MSFTALAAIEDRLIQDEVLLPLKGVLQHLGLSVEVTYGARTDNPAVCLDAGGQSAIGRLTWWADGSFYAEVLSVINGEQRVSRHGFAETTFEAALAFKDVVEHLGPTHN